MIFPTFAMLALGGSQDRALPDGDLFAYALAGLGDVDSDGREDLLVGDETDWPADSRRPFAWALSPARGEVLFAVGNGEERLAASRSLVGLPDVNEDERPDFAAFLRVDEGEIASFLVVICSGRDGSRLASRRIVEREQLYIHSMAMLAAGDFDRDERPDLLISGSWSHDDEFRHSRV